MNKRILFITAYSPTQFGGAVRDRLETYFHLGFDADLLTLYGFPGQKSNQMSIYPRTLGMRISELRQKVAGVQFIRDIYHMFRPSTPTVQKQSKYLRKGNNTIILEDESKPVVGNDIILSKIKKEYDYYILYGWQDMMSSSTVEAIYDRYHKPIIILCADMYQLTGNCFYTANCEKYKDECRNCPVFTDRVNKDQAHKNYLFKKRVYNKTGCYIVAHSHQRNYLQKSGIINDEQILSTNATIDTALYTPLNRETCRLKFGLETEQFYLFLRYTDPNSGEYQRKGLHLFEQSLKIVYNQLSDDERKRVVVMFAGVNKDMCKISYDFKTIAIGILDIQNLIKAYNASSVFVCPSVDDAGPTMVNQSIACGTPVIAYNQGTALDVIEDGYNGFKATLGDVEAFANCIIKAFRLSKNDYERMRENAREMSIRKNSYEANYKQMEERFAFIDKHFKG